MSSDLPRLDDRQVKERMAVVRAYFRNRSGLATMFDYDFHRAFALAADVHDELIARSEETEDE